MWEKNEEQYNCSLGGVGTKLIRYGESDQRLVWEVGGVKAVTREKKSCKKIKTYPD